MEYSRYEQVCKDFTAAEWQALEVHRYYLSERAGHDVGIVATVEDWLLHYSAGWRKARLQKDLADQAKEILKHKWIESEKAGRDIGFERALTDWIIKHRSKWRKSRQQAVGQ